MQNPTLKLRLVVEYLLSNTSHKRYKGERFTSKDAFRVEVCMIHDENRLPKGGLHVLFLDGRGDSSRRR